MTPPIHLRTATPSDEAVLFHIFASTRWEELAPTGWTDQEKTTFLQMQFSTQQRYYQQVYPDADFLVIITHDAIIGRLYLATLPTERRIIDIALLPAYRNQGIGSILLKKILKTAAEDRLNVGIHVEKNNPARLLYERLGFNTVADAGVYWRMEWLADPQPEVPVF